MEEVLEHYGTPRHSGRYPWGSGDNPYQRNGDVYTKIKELEKSGKSEKEISEELGLTSSRIRAIKSLARAEKRKADVAEAIRLKEKGYSNVEIGKRMGINESSVRSLLDPAIQERTAITENTAEMLKKSVEHNKYIDIGAGIEYQAGVSRTRLNNAIEMLKEEGYKVSYIQVEQAGTGKMTTLKVLTKEDTPYGDIVKNKDQIKMLVDSYSEDGGRTFRGILPPLSVDSKRIDIAYYEDGGKDKDGVIEIRRGVPDLSMGDANYAQVRIAVDGTHYLKGMAMYSDDLPEGIDIRFNTNKHNDVSKMDVMKEMKNDPDNPFGATVRQKIFVDKDGKEHVTSALNIVNEEGDWGKWSKTLASQVLSKQPISLASKQLNLMYDEKEYEFNEIMELNNSALRKKLLISLADDCDASSVHLKAAAMPRQMSHVILPITDMPEDQIYAPNYQNGETVVLIRYPHGGKFEIPQLTVNNRQPTANKLMKNAKDAVGINSKVAERLSGADFDGDTVLVIPNNTGAIKTSSPLKGLENFDPKESYKGYPGMKVISSSAKQKEMGKISNLITDMTIKGASPDEICRAVRHSMVVIDAEKHKLNYKQSYIDNNIAELKEKYQSKGDGRSGGASTLISRASSDYRVKERTQSGIDPETGEKIFKETGRTYKNKKGQDVEATFISTRMAETKDARTLSSGTRMEEVYANHANKLKALANKCRKASIDIPATKSNPSAKKIYAEEISSLNAKLNIALKNAPKERAAQLLANKIIKEKRKKNPDMTKEELKKVKYQTLDEARRRYGAKKQRIDISEKEWKAIQSGAISDHKLSQILDNTDLDIIKKYATPKTTTGLTNAKLSRAKALLANGYSQKEVADAIGVSVSTLQNGINS